MIKLIQDVQFNKQYRVEILRANEETFNTLGVYENCELILKDSDHLEILKNAISHETAGLEYESIPDEEIIIVHQLDLSTKSIIITTYE